MSQFNDCWRSIENYWDDPAWLGKRMLFLSGPRQVGKTTLVRDRLCPSADAYFNWDDRKVRQAYRANSDFFVGTKSPWVCFDEIHKRPHWKDILKGVYDAHKEQYRFVVTGSARLETFKKSGDSLVGRYFHTHLFPLNLPDFSKNDFQFPQCPLDLIQKATDLPDAKQTDDLMARGGFPEPFYAGSDTFWKRWSLQHRDLILTEDLRDLSKITDVDKMVHLFEMLIPVSGQLTSNLNLARDLETTHVTVKRWLEMLYRLHLIFPVSPYSTKIRRAYKKEKKWYFMDWRIAQGNVFENWVAHSLMRAAILYQDRFGESVTLHFVRTHDGAEVDFLLCRDKKPWLLVEAKEGSPEISSAVYRFTDELKIPCVVVTSKPHFVKKVKSPAGQTIYALSWAKLGQVLP